MLVVNLGWLPQRGQFGESGFGAALSMPPKIAARPKRQVNFREKAAIFKTSHMRYQTGPVGAETGQHWAGPISSELGS
jgi:hypothetical protein